MDSQAEINGVVIEQRIKPESRTRRASFILAPSVYEKAKAKCERLGISVNECINQFLEKWVSEDDNG